MKITEQLKKIIRQSQYVILRDKFLNYVRFIFRIQKDGTIEIVRFGDHTFIEQAKASESSPCPFLYKEDYLKDFEFVTAYTEIEPYEKGQKVRVREDAKKICKRWDIYWNEKMNEMIGKTCEIYCLDGSYYAVWNEDKTEHWLFPHAALEPVLEEDEAVIELTTEQMIAEIAEKRGVKPENIKIK